MNDKNKYCAYIHIHTCQIANKDDICVDTYIKTEFNGKPQLVWDNIKTIIKSFKDNDEEIDLDSLIHELLNINDYEEIPPTYNKSYNYYIDILYDNSIIKIIAYNHVNIDQKIICFTDRYIINPEINEGNCIDDFIRRGVEPLVENINDLKESIKSRVKEREISISYHSTGCFERDFTEISLIKKQAEKIIENCNKHLERISEFYTR